MSGEGGAYLGLSWAGRHRPCPEQSNGHPAPISQLENSEFNTCLLHEI